jgi:pilus assembly protein CpaB
MGNNETRTLWISVMVALFAMFMLYSWSESHKDQLAAKYGTVQRVVVAAKDIEEMADIDESMLEIKELPKDFVQPDAILEADTAIGQVAAAPIKKGEQVLQTKLLLPGPDTGLSSEISPGKRAITMPIDDMRGVSRLLRPGDRVDIVAAVDYGKAAEQRREIRTILQDVVVLATGVNVVNKIPRRLELDANGKSIMRVNLSATVNFTSITVEVKPQEAQQLVYILSTSPGSLFTVLRHPTDRNEEALRTTVVEDLLGKPALLRAPAQAPPTQAPAQPPPPPAAAPSRGRGNYQEF